MKSINTDEEFICSVGSKDFGKVKSFLESLSLSGQDAEVLDQFSGWCWDSVHELPGSHWRENAFAIESDDGEKLLVIFGKGLIHLILKKNTNFEQLKQKILDQIPFGTYQE